MKNKYLAIEDKKIEQTRVMELLKELEDTHALMDTECIPLEDRYALEDAIIALKHQESFLHFLTPERVAFEKKTIMSRVKMALYLCEDVDCDSAEEKLVYVERFGKLLVRARVLGKDVATDITRFRSLAAITLSMYTLDTASDAASTSRYLETVGRILRILSKLETTVGETRRFLNLAMSRITL